MSLDFNKQAQVGNAILNQLARELGNSDDTQKAGRVLKAVLYGIRDNIPLSENMQLLSQLPMALKGIYVQNWNPQKEKKQRIHSLEEFIELIKDYDYPSEEFDFGTDAEARSAIIVVVNLLRQYISKGEREDIKAVMPKPLKQIWDKETVID